MISNKTIAAAMTAGALGAAALVGAPAADASPMGYLQKLNNYGIIITNTTAALATGAQVCEALNTTTGDVVATNLFVNSSWAEIPNIETALVVVVVAVEELCPWHDHRAELVHGEEGPVIRTNGPWFTPPQPTYVPDGKMGGTLG